MRQLLKGVLKILQILVLWRATAVAGLGLELFAVEEELLESLLLVLVQIQFLLSTYPCNGLLFQYTDLQYHRTAAFS
jgi:hypothetical protein